MMNSENNIRLLYELNTKDAQLDFAIRQAERQLAGVNKKLQMLWYDVAISVAVIVFPWGVYMLFSRSRFFLMVAFCTALKGVYMMVLPLLLCQFARAARLLNINRENAAEYTEPVRLGTLRGDPPEREPSYRAEQKKLVCILSRYYLNKDKLLQLRRQITESGSGTMTLAELYYELNNLPFYEEVRPAQEFGVRESAEKTGGGIGRLLLPSLIIGLIFALCVWGVI